VGDALLELVDGALLELTDGALVDGAALGAAAGEVI